MRICKLYHNPKLKPETLFLQKQLFFFLCLYFTPFHLRFQEKFAYYATLPHGYYIHLHTSHIYNDYSSITLDYLQFYLNSIILPYRFFILQNLYSMQGTFVPHTLYYINTILSTNCYPVMVFSFNLCSSIISCRLVLYSL